MRILVPIVVFAIATVPAFAQQETFQQITYTLPAGWTANSASDQFRQFTHSQPTSYCVVTVYAATASTGSAQTDFQEEWQNRILIQAATSEKLFPQTAVNTKGVDLVMGAADITLNVGETLFVYLVVAEVNSMRQSILFAFGSRTMMALYQNEIQLFLESIEKAGSVKPPVNIAAGKKLPDAATNQGTFYYGVEISYVGISSGRNPRYLYLLPDGRFQWGFYQHGYYNYDYAREVKTSPGFCGTWSKISNGIHLTFADQGGYRPDLILDEKENLYNNSGKYTLLRFSSLNNKMLEGTYFKEGFDPAVNGGVMPTATFYKDGRFDDRSLLCMGESTDYSLAYDQITQYMNENKVPGKGSYRILDHSLLLTYDDGRQRELLIYVFDEGGPVSSPETVVVAGIAFSRVK